MICQNSQAKMKCHFVGRATSILRYSTSSFSSSRALSKSRADGVRPGEYSGSVICRLSFNFSKSCLAFSVLRAFPSWQMRKKSTRESAWKTWLKQKHQNFSSLNCSEPFWAVTQQHHKPISPEKKTTPNHAPNRARRPSAQPLKHLERWRGYRALHNSPSLRHQADSHDKHQVWGTEITSDQEDHMSSRYDTNDMMICTVSTIHPITHHQIEVYLWSCIVLLIKDPTLPYSTYLSITVYLSTDQISFNSISPVCEIQSMVYQIKLNKPYHIILSLSPLYKTPKHPQHQCRLVYLHIPIYSIYIYLSIFLLPESSVVYLWSRNRSMKQSIHRINLQPI